MCVVVVAGGVCVGGVRYSTRITVVERILNSSIHILLCLASYIVVLVLYVQNTGCNPDPNTITK